MKSSNKFTTLMMDTGEEKVRFRNYLKHYAQRKKRPKNGYCNNHCTKYIYQHQTTFLPNASMPLFAKPNDIHQANILYLPHDRYENKVYKYALNIVDVDSRYKGSYQLTTKNSKEVAQAFQWIYENTLLTYPRTLTIDDGKEFYGDTTKLIEKYDVIIQLGNPSQHRSQGIVERFNRTLADRLFSCQCHKELEDPSKSNGDEFLG